jgi:phospholipid/cholesterol/gamma-HCH transport system substrate-binding protein
METKANYVLIGLFTLAAIAAGLGFFLWLAKVQIDRTYTQYDVVFDQVSGLGQASAVTFNGVSVGKVLTIALDHADPSKVRVRIEVSASTPVREGTQATLASQGVTGVSYVGLTGGGDADAKFLPIDPDTEVAEIPSTNTAVQSLLASAPDILDKTTSVLNGIERFATKDNADHVASIIANLDEASGRLKKVMDDLSTATASFSSAADKISAFADKLDDVAGNANATISDARKTLADARSALADIDQFAAKGLPQITTQITALSGQTSKLVTDLSSLVARIQRDPARFFLGNRTPDYSR